MNQVFEPFTIIVLIVAVIVFWRLRSVLGTRTGHERSFDPFSNRPQPSSEKRSDRSQSTENVITLPGTQRQAEADDGGREQLHEEWKNYTEEGSEIWAAFEKITDADHAFSPKSFIEGAKIAYEMIVTDFADGNKETLRNLLSADVFTGFSQAIDDRMEKNHHNQLQFVGIDEVEFRSVSVKRKIATVTMRFVSQMISATLNEEGEVVDGDPMHVQEITDIWSFERHLDSKDPNWTLVATQETA